jgi:hypothetical protein
MTNSQFYVLCAILLVGILLSACQFISLNGRFDVVIKKMSELSSRVAVLGDRHGR